MEYFASKGARICIPVGHSPDWDFLAVVGGEFRRVQVKTTRCFRLGRWEVSLATRGGNQSWSGVSKTLDPCRFDYLFVLVADGRSWLIPSEFLESRSELQLGGPKYARWEVERGRPLDVEGDDRPVAL